MTGPENIVNFFGGLFRRVNPRFDKFELEIGGIRSRMVVVEEGLASMSTRIATVEVSMAGVVKRIDRVASRLERIERRLDLVEVR